MASKLAQALIDTIHDMCAGNAVATRDMLLGMYLDQLLFQAEPVLWTSALLALRTEALAPASVDEAMLAVLTARLKAALAAQGKVG